METDVLTIQRIKELTSEILYNKTSKVTKVTDNSVINAILFSISKIGQKGLKDIAISESKQFPESAVGTILDGVALRTGVPARFGAVGSSTFVRLVGAPGTQYIAATHIFTSNSGVQFELAQDVTLGDLGYTYANVRSRDVGNRTNVAPVSIRQVTPVPTGHSYVVNEFQAIGGADSENDILFRQRIMNYTNILAESTLEKFTQIFISINNNVLRLLYRGLTEDGRSRLGVLAQNGAQFSQSELDQLLNDSRRYFSISDLRREGNETIGIQLENIDFFPLDIDFTVDLVQNFDPDSLRVDLQTKFARNVNYTTWQDGGTVEWEELLFIVRSTQGVRVVPDRNFLVNNKNADEPIPSGLFPRFRGFIMRDLDGNIIVDQQGNLNPVFFSNTVNGLNQIL